MTIYELVDKFGKSASPGTGAAVWITDTTPGCADDYDEFCEAAAKIGWQQVDGPAGAYWIPVSDYRDKDNCWRCDGNGEIVADCIEDCCACADPEAEHGYMTCTTCDGRGWMYAEEA